jgi:serine/threonine-protein kinase
VGLASYYYVVPEYSPISNAEAMPKAKAASEKALQLDSTSAEAHAVLAGVHASLLEWEAAEHEFKRALELNPNDANAFGWYAFLLVQEGRFSEAIDQANRAFQLEPLNVLRSVNVAFMYSNARRYDEALEHFNKALELDPGYSTARFNLAINYRAMGKYDLWLEEWKKGATLDSDREELAMAEEAARVYSKLGYPAAVTRMIEMRKQLGKRRYVDPATIAYDCAAVGDKDQAFAWLDRAYAEKSDLVGFVKVNPEMDSLHSDPRYVALLKKMGLPQ